MAPTPPQALAAPPNPGATPPPLVLELLLPQKFLAFCGGLLQLPLQVLQPRPQLPAPHHGLLELLRAGTEAQSQEGRAPSWGGGGRYLLSFLCHPAQISFFFFLSRFSRPRDQESWALLMDRARCPTLGKDL